MTGDARLLAWLTGALEPGEALAVQEAVRAAPALQARLPILYALLQEPPQPPPPWRIPPPGLPGGRAGFQLQVIDAGMMHGIIRPGDRFRVSLPLLPDAAQRTVVVLCLEADSWQVLFPSAPEESVSAAILPVDEAGQPFLDLRSRDRSGEQRWAVALPLLADGADRWQRPPADRWTDLQEAIVEGTVPVASVQIQVA